MSKPYPTFLDVPPLLSIERFRLAAHFAMTEWVHYMQQAEWRRRGEPRWMPDPCVGATLADDLLTHGSALWEHVRSVFASYYEGGLGAEEHYIAEHRFLAALRLRDRVTEPTLQPWMWPRQPFWLTTPLITSAAEARLILWHASMDDPLEEHSEFDLGDLLGRAQALHDREIAEDQASWAEKFGPSRVPPREWLSAFGRGRSS